MYVFVGLGNPGDTYSRSRHNLGRMVLERILLGQGESLSERGKHVAHMGTLTLEGRAASVLLPNTFMNKSGSSVKTLIKSVKSAAKLVVVYDDIDLPWGTIRIAWNRSSGGHNGVESVITALKTKEFIRIRIGVALATPGGKLKKPRGEKAVVDFLMHDLSKKETEELPSIVKRVEHALRLIVSKGREAAMNEINSG